MRLWTSSNGGASFVAHGAVASIGHDFAGASNARLALASNGGGFLTFRDSGGLEVSDLVPLPTKHSQRNSHRR